MKKKREFGLGLNDSNEYKGGCLQILTSSLLPLFFYYLFISICRSMFGVKYLPLDCLSDRAVSHFQRCER